MKMKVPKINIEGLPIEKADLPMQLIAVLTKRLGGKQLINVNKEIKEIKGFILSVNPQGNILIEVS